MKLMDIVREMNGQAKLIGRSENVEVESLCMDSRMKMGKGTMFFCIPGFTFDGHNYAAQAVKAGVSALVVERELDVDCPQLLVADAREAAARIAAIFYGHPAKEMKLIGITGTKGKTTTSFQVKSILETAGYKGLFSFVSHLRFLLENGDQPAGAASGVLGGVQIMSIHKSKGLEFPIVILADLNKQFNQMDLQTPVLVHPKLGLGPMYIDLERHIRYPTIARDAIAARMSREMRAEEMRVLYVGMTRAKEKLIMVASMQSAAKKLADLTAVSALPVPAETVDGAKSMAEWILLPLLQRREALELRSVANMDEGVYALTEDTTWRVAFHDGMHYSRAGIYEEQGEVGVNRTELTFDRIALDFVYPHSTACLTPTKLTATQLKGRIKDEEIAENTSRPYYRCSFEAPAFVAGEVPLTADQRGTATHLVMQYLPLDGNVAETIRQLLEKHLLTEEQARSVDRRSIERFLVSPLADELRAAKSIEREYRFSLLVDAKDYYNGVADDDQVLLQGVVDLFAETEQGVIVVDFKTDYVTQENLEDKISNYRPQIEAYSMALEQILEKKVIRKVLYFLRTGQAIEI